MNPDDFGFDLLYICQQDLRLEYDWKDWEYIGTLPGSIKDKMHKPILQVYENYEDAAKAQPLGKVAVHTKYIGYSNKHYLFKFKDGKEFALNKENGKLWKFNMDNCYVLEFEHPSCDILDVLWNSTEGKRYS